MSDLRTRIAAVICGMDALHAEQWSLDVADAVIRELNLQPEQHEWPYLTVYRYITDWEPQ